MVAVPTSFSLRGDMGGTMDEAYAGGYIGWRASHRGWHIGSASTRAHHEPPGGTHCNPHPPSKISSGAASLGREASVLMLMAARSRRAVASTANGVLRSVYTRVGLEHPPMAALGFRPATRSCNLE